MRQLKAILALLFIVTLSSCNNPLNKQYNEKTLEEDAKAIRESKKLTDDEMELLGAYIIREKLGNVKLDGLTYLEMLKKAKDIKAEQKALAEKVAKEDADKRQRLGAAVNVALFDIGFSGDEFQKYFVYRMAFENKSGKEIKAIKGTLIITDLFDQKIKTLNIVFDKGVKIGEVFKTDYTTEYNQFIEEDQQLKSKTIKL